MADVDIVPAAKVTQVRSSSAKVVDLRQSPATTPPPAKPAEAPAPPAEKPAAAPPEAKEVAQKSSPVLDPKKAADDFYGKLRTKAEPPKVEPPKAETEEAETEVEPEATEAEPAQKSSPVDQKKAKVNPWKLVDEHKAERAKLEAELLEIRKLVKNEAERKAEIEAMERTKARLKELEDEMRFTRYEKSTEFTEQFEKPYQEYWVSALEELKEVPVNDNGETRQISAQDLVDLVQLPLQKAKELAEERFGDFANEAMSHRKEIRRLYEARTKALEQAKTQGAEREKSRIAEITKRDAEIRSHLTEEFNKATEMALADEENGVYFRPAEGDEERNGLLTKGYELVDQAFRENPLDPKFSPEERATIVRRQVAVRNRAAAYGTLKYLLRKSQENQRALEERLAQYEGSSPDLAGGSGNAQKPSGRASAWDTMRQRLQSKATQ